MKLLSKILSTAGLSFLSTASQTLLSFIHIPFILKNLGLEAFGLLSTLALFSHVGYFNIFEFGLVPTLSRAISKNLAAKNLRNVANLFLLFFFSFLIVGIVAQQIGVYLSELIHLNQLNIPERSYNLFKQGLDLTFLSFLFYFPLFVVVGFLEGTQSYKILKGSEVLLQIINSSLIIFYSYQPQSNFITVLKISIILNFIRFTGLFLFILYKYPFLLKLKGLDWIETSENLELMRNITLGKIIGILYQNLDKTIIGALGSPNMVGQLELIKKIPNALKTIIGFSNTALIPISTNLSVTNQSMIPVILTKSTKFLFFLFSPLVLIIAVNSGFIFEQWIGAEYVELSFWFSIFIFNIFTIIPMSIGNNLLIGINMFLKQANYISVTGLITKLIISISLIPTLKLGAILTGTFISNIVMLLLFFRFYKKAFQLDFYHFTSTIYRQSFYLFLFFIPVLFRFILPNFKLSLFLISILSGFLYWILVFRQTLETDEKLAIIGLFKRFFQKDS